MSANFNLASITALLEDVKAAAQSLNLFARAYRHEPKNAPGLHLSFALWGADIEALAGASGLNAISGKVTLMARIYTPFISRPEDSIDPALIDASFQYFGALAAQFTLGGLVRNIDLLGQFGQALRAQLGYLDQDGTKFRVSELTIPVVINDLFTEAA